jgi:hypothetical protein
MWGEMLVLSNKEIEAHESNRIVAFLPNPIVHPKTVPESNKWVKLMNVCISLVFQVQETAIDISFAQTPSLSDSLQELCSVLR